MAAEDTSATDETQTDNQANADDVVVPDGAKNPDAVSAAIRAEREKARTEKSRADELATKVSEYENRDKTEQQKLDERAKAAETNAAEAARKLARYEVAAAKGVPLEQAHRLQGDTKEALEKDADAFLKSLTATSPPPDFGGGSRTTADDNDMNAQIRRAAGRA